MSGKSFSVLGAVLGESHEGEDERLLLSDLVDQDQLTSGLSELVVDERTRDGGEDEQVHEDEDDEEDVVGLVVLDCQDLVVWVEVVGGNHVDVEYHFSQVSVVVLVTIYFLRIFRVSEVGIDCESSIADQGPPKDDDGEEDDIDFDVGEGRSQREEGFSHLRVVEHGDN